MGEANQTPLGNCIGCGGETPQQVMGEMNANAGPRWRSLGRKLDQRVTSVCEAWRKSRYEDGQRVRGRAVDCVQLVAGVLDQLTRNKDATEVPSIATDAAIHQPNAAMPTVMALVRGFDAKRVSPDVYEPGDIAVVRPELQPDARDEAGHALIAGGEAWRWLHATPNTGACWTSLATLPPVIALYRPNKESW